MTEKLEQVARAICRQAQIDEGYCEEQADRGAQQGMWRNFRDQARAAIEALRVPTKEMIEAGLENTDYPSAIWQDMIDAACEQPVADLTPGMEPGTKTALR